MTFVVLVAVGAAAWSGTSGAAGAVAVGDGQRAHSRDDPVRRSLADAADARERRGLPPLRRTKRLDRIARKYVRASAKAGELLPIEEFDRLLAAVPRPTIAATGVVDPEGEAVPITGPEGEARREASEIGRLPIVVDYGVAKAKGADGTQYQGLVLGAAVRDETALAALEAQAVEAVNAYRDEVRSPPLAVDPALVPAAEQIAATGQSGDPTPPGTMSYWFIDFSHDALLEGVLDLEYLEERFDRPEWENIRLDTSYPGIGRTAAAYVADRGDGTARLAFVFA